MSGFQRLTGRIRDEYDREWLSVPVGLLAGAGVLLYAPVGAEMATMLAITVFCISLWVGGPVDPWFTGLLGVGLIGAAVSTDLALVGFRSPATWLVVLGILIGEATDRSGLGAAVERRVLAALPGEAATDARVAYRYMLAAFSAAALGLIVVVPSSLVRVLILGPILISAGERFADRRPRVGLFLGPLFVTYYAGTGVLTGSLANIIITGLVEANAGVAIGWVEWAVWLGPVMGAGRAAVIAAIAYVLYRPRDADAIEPSRTRVTGDAVATDGATDTTDGATDATDGAPSGTDPAAPEIDRSAVRRMLAFLLVGVVIWATDVIHGLHPLYGALVVVLLAFAPGVGVVDADALADADFSIVFFLGAIFAIAEGLQRTGFTDAAARQILSYLPPDASLAVVLAFVVVASMSLTFLMEGLAVASVLTPVFVSFAAGAGAPLVPVAMTEAVALNTYFFPYQSAVLVAILGLDVVEPLELVKMAAVCSLATLLVLLPIQIAVFAVLF
ncbi:SLC13 family permease [Halorussus sp. AFM4]|uniref:SLC13 family permease n=1 Tax=Halorussus sp. AFM4 TaxID=3421651 RepID=UPI003EB7C48C